LDAPLIRWADDYLQVDAIVKSVNHMGFFADAGPLPIFVSSHVSRQQISPNSAL
jgi:DNA-directed RNA polymerase subunit E'/Rpb7